jgi:hypothetical protein
MAAAATTLYDYYGGQLPSVSARAGTYGSLGLGNNYAGTAAQNIALLSKLQAGGASSSSAPAPSSTPPVGTISTPANQATPQDQYNAAVKAAQDYWANTPTPDQTYQDLITKNGIPDVQSSLKTIAGNIGTQQNLLSNLEPDINKRTTGFDVNESQRRELLAKESAPIAKNIAELTNSEGATREDYNNRIALVNAMLQAAGQATQQKYQPLAIGVDAATKNLDTYNSSQAAANDFKNKTAAEQTAHERQVALENLRTANNIKQSAADRRASGPTAADKAAAKAATDKLNLDTNVQQLSQALSSVAGSDGFVAPEDYLKAERAWTAQGNDPKLFDAYFAGFRNPNQPDWAKY